MSDVFMTLRALYRALQFLWARRHRRLLLLLPTLLNTFLFFLAVFGAFWAVQWLVALPLPDATWASVLALMLGILAVVGVLLVWSVLYVALTGVIGAPIYSLFVEEFLKEQGIASRVSHPLAEMGRSFTYTLKLVLLFAFGQVLLVFLNAIPVLGTAFHLVGTLALTVLFLAMEFFGETFSLLNEPFGKRLRFLFLHLPLTISFAAPVYVLLLVPVLNLVLPPVAMIAAADLIVRGDRHRL